MWFSFLDRVLDRSSIRTLSRSFELSTQRYARRSGVVLRFGFASEIPLGRLATADGAAGGAFVRAVVVCRKPEIGEHVKPGLGISSIPTGLFPLAPASLGTERYWACCRTISTGAGGVS